MAAVTKGSKVGQESVESEIVSGKELPATIRRRSCLAGFSNYLDLLLDYFGKGKPFLQTTERSASSGLAWKKPRLAVQRTSPFKTRLVLLSSGAFCLVAIRMRCEPSGESTQIWFSKISDT